MRTSHPYITKVSELRVYKQCPKYQDQRSIYLTLQLIALALLFHVNITRHNCSFGRASYSRFSAVNNRLDCLLHPELRIINPLSGSLKLQCLISVVITRSLEIRDANKLHPERCGKQQMTHTNQTTHQRH